MNTSTDGAAAGATLAGETTPLAPSVVSAAASRLTAVLGVPVLALILSSLPQAAAVLQFDRAALAAGEPWRLLTGHLVHFGRAHLLWDVAAFVLLAGLLPPLSLRRWVALLIIPALVISAAVWWLQPHFMFYRGLSGVDCALFGAVLAARLRAARRGRDYTQLTLVLALGAVFVAKCVWEITTGSAVFVSEAGFAPVPLAHATGALAGFASLLAPGFRDSPAPT